MKKMDEGAEAILIPAKFAGFSALKKVRVQKKYRPSELDEKIRFSRTKVEARLLHKAKEAGVLCPYVFAIGEDFILMEKIDGKTLNKIEKKIDLKVYRLAGEYLAKLHSHNIMHGDYTPANLMLDGKGKLYVIDFGLGFSSHDFEDMAVDLLTMENSLSDENAKKFLSGYEKIGRKEAIVRMEKVRKRARYKDRKTIVE
ncbi:MAG: KEOPS complex kinase/ATPase Bud32 [Candidatus Micrarchaeia archaeon]